MTPRMFILTRGDREQATAETFRHMNPTVVTHDAETAARIETETGAATLVSGVAKGIRGKVEQQRWLFTHHVAPGEWVIVADDNIHGVLGIPPEDRGYWEFRPSGTRKHQALRAPLASELWTETLPETIGQADRIGAHLIGFASNANPLSRLRRWGTCSFVWGKITLWKAEPDFPWDDRITVLDDYCNTALHLERHGRVLVDYDTYMEGRRYEPGGLGLLGERMSARAHDIAYLQARFPGLFRERLKPNGEQDISITRNRKTIKTWRRAHLSALTARG